MKVFSNWLTKRKIEKLLLKEAMVKAKLDEEHRDGYGNSYLAGELARVRHVLHRLGYRP